MSNAVPLGQQSLELQGPSIGFRLHQVELYNWGTLSGKVWSIPAAGHSVLLTGEIGSGKSTVVDALTTLLVPQRQRRYNHAAGSLARERNERSYILGYWNKEQTPDGAEKPIALRDTSSYTVLLAVFRNAATNREVTLAQVLWIADAGDIRCHYFTAEARLSISSDFILDEGGIGGLPKRLRRRAEHHSSFSEYAGWYRRHLGVSEQAIGLFNQTVSMKAVASLTDFVRQHMLEAIDVDTMIAELLDHFADLKQAHEAVVEARAKRAMLMPLKLDADQREGLISQLAELDALDVAAVHVARRYLLRCYEVRLAAARLEQEVIRAELQRLETVRSDIDTDLLQATGDYARQGGERISELKREVTQVERERDACKGRYDRYREVINLLGWKLAIDPGSFTAQLAEAARLMSEEAVCQEKDENERTECDVAFRAFQERWNSLNDHILELGRRRSKIDPSQIVIRERLCTATGLDPSDLPFVGELLQVRAEHAEWEGAAERVLRGFGLSLVVPSQHYRKVSDYVNGTNVRGRLVYYRVNPQNRYSVPSLHHRALSHVIEIHPETPYRDWLKAQLAHRARMVRCDTMEEFRSEAEAVTRNGQVRGGDRHEKDDRFGVNDPSNFVLGWSNQSKIDALIEHRDVVARDRDAALKRLVDLKAAIGKRQNNLNALGALKACGAFSDIDYFTPARRIETLRSEIELLETGSDLLRQLAATIKRLEGLREENRQQLAANQAREGGVQKGIQDDEAARQRIQSQIDAASETAVGICKERLDQIASEKRLVPPQEVDAVETWRQSILDTIAGRRRLAQSQANALERKLVGVMTNFLNSYPAYRQDLDARIEAVPSYVSLHQGICADDLPRLEQRFKELLNENAINQIADFSAKLRSQRTMIQERIALINQSLRSIPYNLGRYIALQITPSLNHDVRTFQEDLRACTEGHVTGSEDDDYGERKFQRVVAIVDRLRSSREGHSDEDRRWRALVTDVRNWFEFSASERFVADDRQHAFYSGTDGKSGGQKEKLAYTVLAASLAYQYGIATDSNQPRSFRFVMIDEAFGKGSEEMARYGMELFRQLDLQVMVITPLKSIVPIEPYVRTVAYMSNPNNNQSTIKVMTIEDFHAERTSQAQLDRRAGNSPATDAAVGAG